MKGIEPNSEMNDNMKEIGIRDDKNHYINK